MESTEQWQQEVGVGAFAGMATALQDHGDRLAQLAEACRAEARELAEREARIDEREQAIAEGFAELDRRRGELDNWKRELEEAASRASEAEARIAEAAEREAALRTIAQAVLARFPAE